MTFKDAILKSLEDLDKPSTYMEVYNHILKKSYRDFGVAKTPSDTVSAILGGFIRDEDTRIKRIKQGNGYLYYLAKYEPKYGTELWGNNSGDTAEARKKSTYEERSLHKLLSSYLKNSTEIYSKTIFHEKSTFDKDNNQIWTHPDMVGIGLSRMQSPVSQKFLKAVSPVGSFKLNSYELKREINSDSELKKAYFQAVSNSSWANYGYLVALEFSDNLMEEIARLNQSFGIGIIELDAYPYKSKVLFPAKYKDLDFKTIDKLCQMNVQFEKFIEQVEKLMIAEDRFYKSTERELEDFCDKCFENDKEIKDYCKEKHIPLLIDQEIE